MPFRNEIDRKKVHDVEDFSASGTTYDNFFSQKKNKSLQLTIALFYLPMVLSMATKQNLIPSYVWSRDWKMLQILYVVCCLQ